MDSLIVSFYCYVMLVSQVASATSGVSVASAGGLPKQVAATFGQYADAAGAQAPSAPQSPQATAVRASRTAPALAPIVAKARVQGVDATFAKKMSAVLGLIPENAESPLPVRRLDWVDSKAGMARGFSVSKIHDDAVVLIFTTNEQMFAYRTDSAGNFLRGVRYTKSSNLIEPIDAPESFEVEKQFWVTYEASRVDRYAPVPSAGPRPEAAPSSRTEKLGTIIEKAKVEGADGTLSYRLSHALGLLPKNETTPLPVRSLAWTDEKAGISRGFQVSKRHNDAVVLGFRTSEEVFTYLTDASGAFKGAAKWTKATNTVEVIKAIDSFEAEKQFWINR